MNHATVHSHLFFLLFFLSGVTFSPLCSSTQDQKNPPKSSGFDSLIQTVIFPEVVDSGFKTPASVSMETSSYERSLRLCLECFNGRSAREDMALHSASVRQLSMFMAFSGLMLTFMSQCNSSPVSSCDIVKASQRNGACTTLVLHSCTLTWISSNLS